VGVGGGGGLKRVIGRGAARGRFLGLPGVGNGTLP